MADDVTLNAGSGGDVIAADDILSVKYQRVKITLGANNTNDGDVASGNPMPVTGTITAVTAITNALPAGTNAIGKLAANSGVDIGDVDVTSCALPTGAATAAKQPALGTAGTASTDVISVQGIASMTPIQVGDNSSSLTVDNAGTFAVQAAQSGTWNVTNVSGTVSLPTGASTAAKQPALGTAGSASTDVITVQGIASMTALVVDGSGVTQPVSGTVTANLAAGTNNIGDVDVLSVVPGTGATSLGKAEDAAHSSGDTGVMALAVRAAAPTERSAGPTDGDYEPLAVNEVGAMWASLTPSANGGCSTFMASGSDGSSILVATAQVIKASAGVLYGYYAYNPESAATFVHFYNTAAASVTVGTTNPLFTIVIPATSAANLALPYGITFSNAGWSCAATTTAGGNTAPATGVSLVAWYK
jgi:hypothetical protein